MLLESGAGIDLVARNANIHLIVFSFVLPADPASDDAFGSIEMRSDIEEALAALPSEFRAAVVLSDVEGLALHTVSEILGVPVGTVKSRVFRGRRILAEKLGNLRADSDSLRDEHHA